jgi:hypothetical protein
MGSLKMQRTLRCYAEGKDSEWEAFCLDFDLAVQGQSFDDVYRKLSEQIELYVEGVVSLGAEDRSRLLSRKAPLLMRISFGLKLLRALLLDSDAGVARHGYEHPMPIGAAV